MYNIQGASTPVNIVEKGFTNRLPVSHSLEFDDEAEELWRIISDPGNLNLCHPFCKSNEVIQWGDGDRSDRLIYLNGLSYVRNFLTWDEGAGYELLIGEEGGPQSYVVWKIRSLDGSKSKLTITVYPYLLAKLPSYLAYIPHAIWLKPRLERYLNSVISGFQYYLKYGKKVPRNHFGKHPWFS